MTDAREAPVESLLTARAVRQAAERAFAAARSGTLLHFEIDEGRLGAIADLVAEETRRNYPDLRVPYHARWRHFEAGGIDRWAEAARHMPKDPAERCRARIGLAALSVLLDAGAGDAWSYREAETGQVHRRSEGLGVASFRLVMSGALSRTEGAPWRIETSPLAFFETDALAAAFQVGPGNPMVGLEGRAKLIRSVGDILWNTGLPQLGALRDRIVLRASGKTLAAPAILEAVLAALGPIWPGRLKRDGVNLGDTWEHSILGLVPFHKLSQWLTYSLVEPLQEEGFEIADLDGLTGLPEYRNGGLLVDGGAIRPKDPRLAEKSLTADDPAVVEWRALTVAFLDRIAPLVRARLGLDAKALPLAAVLQGGTWSAGRRIAREKRPDGGPPFRIVSDGTVF